MYNNNTTMTTAPSFYDFCKNGSYSYDFNEIELTAKQAIAMKCLDCCGYDAKEVHQSNCTHCPLCKFRKWAPKRVSSPLSDEQRAKSSENLKKYREKTLQ